MTAKNGGETVDDKRIIELFFERREEAIDACREKYSRAMLSLARNILGGDEGAAEECLNDTLLALWNAIPPERPEHLLAYVLKIERNLCLKRARHDSAAKRRGAVRDSALDELCEISDGREPTDELMARELSERISSFLRELSKSDRAIFIKRYWLYQSVKTISRETGYGESRIKMSLLRTRKKLCHVLKKEGYIQ